MTEAELVRQAQAGNIAAVGALYDQHQPHIYRYVWSRVRHTQTAEDLTGDIFTRMVSHLGGYRDRALPFRAWLYRIAHNRVVDYYRSLNGHAPLPLAAAADQPSAEPGPAGLLDRQLSLETLAQALDTIDPDQRDVVLLRFVAGLSLREAAHALNRSVASVKALQHRGLRTLRGVLTQESVSF